jgi:fumarylacetoacetate (FAA) hydrolase family protein
VRWKAALESKVTTSGQAPPWTLGIAALMRDLARRGLLPEPQ